MNEFQALISSFGEHAVDYIGKDHLASLEVFGDSGDSFAYVEICLDNNTWSEQSRAIDKMIELREMFLDELAIEYRFIEFDSSTREESRAQLDRSTSFSMA